jgi:phytoene dehydrogenase-like protein
MAGEVAAVALHRAGVRATVLEAGDDVGGRVRTDVVDGFRLDRGFQVLLPAYPALRRLVDVAALRPRPFTRGTIAMTDGGRQWLAGPWHGRPALSGVARFAASHPGDSARVATLAVRDVLRPALADSGRSTAEEFRRWGLSEATVEQVLRPFLAGSSSTRPWTRPPGCSTCCGAASCAAGAHCRPRGCRPCRVSWRTSCRRRRSAPASRSPRSRTTASAPLRSCCPRGR